MVIAILSVLGLMLGSFANALVWRTAQADPLVNKKQNKKLKGKNLSIATGRSVCVHCGHELAAVDLVPVFSWLVLKGRCRYCVKPISWQYPAVELATSLLFVGSYIFWPQALQGMEWLYFGVWLVVVVGFVALTVYDIRWFLLPDKIVFPLMRIASLGVLARLIYEGQVVDTLVHTMLAVFAGGGIFWVLFQISDGTWIGGGDVKLGWLIGLLLGSWPLSFLMIFIASLLGTTVSLPQIVVGRAKKGSHLPFGPYLMAATVVVQLFGASLIAWYKRQIGL